MNRSEREFLKEMVCEIDDIRSTLDVLRVYCNACSETEEIYNIVFLVKMLFSKTDKFTHDLCKFKEEKEPIKDCFLSKITPIDKNSMYIDED